MRPEPFAVLALGSLGVGAYAVVAVPRPLEASLYLAVAAVLGGFAAGMAFGLLDPPVRDREYTGVGAVAVALSFFVVAGLAGRPASGYLTAVLGGTGAALVGFDSGRKRAD